MKIYNFDIPFFGHHSFILSLSVLCLGVEKTISKEIMHFHYITRMNMPLHKNPCTGGYEIYNFDKPFLGHHDYTLSLYGPCPGVEKNIFKENINFTLFTPELPPLGVGGGHDI